MSSGFKKVTSKKLHISSVQRKSVRPKPLLASGKCLVNASSYSLFGVYLLKYLTEKEELRFKHNWLLEKHYLCLNSLSKSSLTHSALTIPDRNSNRNGKNGFSITCLSQLGGGQWGLFMKVSTWRNGTRYQARSIRLGEDYKESHIIVLLKF